MIQSESIKIYAYGIVFKDCFVSVKFFNAAPTPPSITEVCFFSLLSAIFPPGPWPSNMLKEDEFELVVFTSHVLDAHF